MICAFHLKVNCGSDLFYQTDPLYKIGVGVQQFFWLNPFFSLYHAGAMIFLLNRYFRSDTLDEHFTATGAH